MPEKASEKMNIYQKLQACRVALAKKNLKKSGKNKYSGYSYYELGDFLPAANEVMLEKGLTAMFKPNLPGDDIATLTIINLDNTEETHIFSSSVSVANLSGCQEIQNIGATQTYMRRYLYTMALEIADSDAIEPMTGQPAEEKSTEEPLTFEKASSMKLTFGKHKGKTLLEVYEKHPDYVSWFFENGPDDNIKAAFKIIDEHFNEPMDFETLVDETKVEAIKEMLKKTNSPENEFLKFYRIERLEDMTLDIFARAMRALEKKYEKMPKENKVDYSGTPFEDDADDLPI